MASRIGGVGVAVEAVASEATLGSTAFTAGRSEITVGRAVEIFFGSGGVPPAGAPARVGRDGTSGDPEFIVVPAGA